MTVKGGDDGKRIVRYMQLPGSIPGFYQFAILQSAGKGLCYNGRA